MQQSIFKLKINYTAVEGRGVPWELIYLISNRLLDTSKEEDICAKIFKHYLLVRDYEAQSVILEMCKVSKFEVINYNRTDSDITNYPPDAKKQIGELIDGNISDYSLLIPLLAVNKGSSLPSKEYTKRLRYLTSKSYSYATSRSTQTIYQYRQGADYRKFPVVTLCLGKSLKMHPCATCTQFSAKMTDDSACLLGSLKCIHNIVVPNRRSEDA